MKRQTAGKRRQLKMNLKEELRQKLPEDILMTSEYKVLSSIITKQKLKSVAELKNYIRSEISRTNDWLNENRKQSKQGTMNRWLRQHTKELDFLMLINSKVLGYL